MNEQKFTDKHLSSLASIMLLAPAMQRMLKEKTVQLPAEEVDFVRSYIRYGYFILTVIGAALLIWAVYSFLIPLTLLYRVNYILLGGAIAMILYGVFSITNNKMIVAAPGSSLPTNTTTSPSALIYFLPLYNYYLWYNEPFEGANKSQLKESILWRTLYIIVISIWPLASIMLLGAILIIVRALTLMIGMSILSEKGVQNIDAIFNYSPEELVAYPLGLLSHCLKKIGQKTSNLNGEIESWKLSYSPLDPLRKRRTIVQYIITLAAVGYRGYTTRLVSGPTVGIGLSLLPQIMLLGKLLMTIPSGKLPRVPLLYTLLGGKQDPIAIGK